MRKSIFISILSLCFFIITGCNLVKLDQKSIMEVDINQLEDNTSKSGLDYNFLYTDYLPNFDMRNVNAYCCGPTAGAEILAYWASHHGKKLLWKSDWNDADGINAINHLIEVMGTTPSNGTTPEQLKEGMKVYTKSSSDSYSANVNLIKKKNTNLTNICKVISDEIDKDHPVAIYIGKYPKSSKYYNNKQVPAKDYYYHWQVICGYEKSEGSFIVYTRTGFGKDLEYGEMDLVTYWNYTEGKKDIDIAIVTYAIQ